MGEYYHCPVCRGRALSAQRADTRVYSFDCMRCGKFRADHYFVIQMRNTPFDLQQVANASGYIFENQGQFLTADSIPQLLSIPTPNVAAKAEKMLAFIGDKARPGRKITPGVWQTDGQIEMLSKLTNDPFPLDPASEEACAEEFPYLAASWSVDQTEAQYLIYEHLIPLGLLERQDQQVRWVKVSPKGWEAIQARPLSLGTVGFVAMWFDKSLTSVWSGPIRSGVQNAGYQAFRVDDKEHNDDVTDEIIAGIRSAKFVLADFTDHRGGVYYEAGFAFGLGKPVIRTVRRDHADALHFDTRQLNHILWDENAPEAFAKAITNRIIATIGKGPLSIP